MKKIICLLLSCIFLVLFCSCDQNSDSFQEGAEYNSNQTHQEEQVSPPTTEPEPSTIGKYSLEKLVKYNYVGIFVAYEDGSFDGYPTGGYVWDAEEYLSYISGYFVPGDLSDKIDRIDANAKLVVFSPSSFSLTLFPIHASVSCLDMSGETGQPSYGKIGQLEDYGSSLRVYYENGDYDVKSIEYINGVPAHTYEAVKIENEVHPSKGIPSRVETVVHYGFTAGENITLACSEGTRLIEESYIANATFYDCYPDHNDYSEPDEYDIQLNRTSEGYAILDFSEVPSGRYVMIFSIAERIYPTLVDIP